VLGPYGDRVAQVLTDHSLERLAILRTVEMPEDIVEGAVLEEDQYDVVEGVGRVECRHQIQLFSLGRIGQQMSLECSPR
jgi:hypothetical protein